MAYVACGRLEAFWEFNLNPWDTAAGILLVEEAGGRVTDFCRQRFRLDSREILASNGLIQGELVELVQGYVCGARFVAYSDAAGVCAHVEGRKEPESGGSDSQGSMIPASQIAAVLKGGSHPLGSCATISVEKLSSPENSDMAYVIAEPCIGTKDTACVDACPVDCIHPKKDEDGFGESDQLFIDPVECIDCGACVPACPVSAIFAPDDLPEKWAHFTEKNATHFGR